MSTKLTNSDVFITDGWIHGARRVPSPNYNDRPANSEISLLVIHNISLPPVQFGQGYIEQFFCNALDCSQHPYFLGIADMKVSSHLLISREGELIQFVPLHQRAWHAGQSVYEGREECNDFSIGIELEGTDETAYTDKQYKVLTTVSRQLLHDYPALTVERIVGHSDIAPGRKTDPGSAFNWQRYRQSLIDNRP